MESNGFPESANPKAEMTPGRVLYVGQSYYNTWYLSRALRKLGWKADTLNFDPEESNQIYYHGEDFRFHYRNRLDVLRHVKFFFKSLHNYDIFHFSGKWGLHFLSDFDQRLSWLPQRWDIKLLKRLGKKIVYSNNGCMDGVSQSSFRTWKPEPVCDICPWRDLPHICSDENNLAWGKLRNSLADYQLTLGGNRKDYNDDPSVHEVPEFYCLDSNLWNPDLLIPTNYRLLIPQDTVKIYHSIGNFHSRTDAGTNRNIKSTHIYIPTIERLKNEGHNVEMVFLHDVPNEKIRYYQAQADIVVDMLTFGWFGANVREAMMLGKPAICFLRPEWLQSIRREIPEYVDELPVISATPETVYEVLKDLIENPEKRREIGRRSRDFAVKWHSAEAGAKRLAHIYSQLLSTEK
jgi:glycosyltransferase involved in cell wall biosynthesis